MKYLLTNLICLFSLVLFAQSTGDIERDTALANTYYQSAMSSIEHNRYGEDDIRLLKNAIEIYEAYPFAPKIIEIKGAYAFVLTPSDEELAKKEALQTIELAEQYNEEQRLGAAYTALSALYKYKMYKRHYFILKKL